jgi:hypothetical protein
VKENLAFLYGNIADIDSDAAMQKCKIRRQSMLPIATIKRRGDAFLQIRIFTVKLQVCGNPNFLIAITLLRAIEAR